jgi:hypothetical protein
MKVKLMMCKDSKQKQMKNAGNKRLLLNAKINNFSQRKTSFSFQFFLRFNAANIQEFHSTTSYLFSKCIAKTYEQKDFSLAIDAETQSSNKEENEHIYLFIYFLFLFTCESSNKGKIPTSLNQRTKTKFWLKAQITKNQSKDTQWQSRNQRLLCLSKNHNTKCFFFIFYINYQLRKNRLRVRGLNLLTVQP